MSRYATPPVYQWHKIESHQYGYSVTPTFTPPTPPVLVPPVDPFGFPPGLEPEPKASDDEKKDGSAEEPASEQKPGMYIDSL